MITSPAFQVYVQDFLLGTLDFTAEETGGYFLLLLHQWDKGFIPNNEKKIKKLSKLSKKALPTVLQKFVIGEDGNLRNLRLEIERDKQLLNREKAVQAGIKSGEVRKKKAKHSGTEVELKTNGRSGLVGTKIEQDGNATGTLHISSSISSSINTGDVPLVGLEGSGIVQDIVRVFKTHLPNYHEDLKKDFPAAFQIAGKIAEANGWGKFELNEKREDILKIWAKMGAWAATHKWFSTRPLCDISNEWQRFHQGFYNLQGSGNLKAEGPVKINLR